jgi:hypothetical protein
MKLCKDCLYFVPGFHVLGYGGEPARCLHPDVPIEPVYGAPMHGPAELRAGNCGPEAGWFEEKPAPAPAPVEVASPKRSWWQIGRPE